MLVLDLSKIQMNATGINCELWIKDFVNDEYLINQIPNYLKACHHLREMLGLKHISDAELIKRQLERYKAQKERDIRKKLERGKNGE